MRLGDRDGGSHTKDSILNAGEGKHPNPGVQAGPVGLGDRDSGVLTCASVFALEELKGEVEDVDM